MRQLPAAKGITTAVFCLGFFLLDSASANGTVITDPNQLFPGATLIDLEGFATGGNLVTDVPDPLTIGNVTFTSVTGNLSIFDISVAGWATDGTAVASKTLFPGGEPDSAISIEFATPVSQFLVGWGGADFPGNVLRAFDAAGNLLEEGAVALVPPHSGEHVAWIGFSRPTADIAKIVVQPAQPLPSGDDYVIDNIFYSTAQPFGRISSRLDVKMDPEGNDDKFQLSTKFDLGPNSNGINPMVEAVTIRVGKFSRTIPAGSFTRTKNGVFAFQGAVGGTSLTVSIRATRAGYELQALGNGADLGQSTLPLAVGLAIGDDAGTNLLTRLAAESE
jgi:hypothetical protein